MSHLAAISALKPLFRFPLENRQATGRFAVGGGLFIASILIPFVPALFGLGYCVQILRRTAGREGPSMHAWTDWGRLFVDGLRGWLISFLFFLPGAAAFALGAGVYLATFFPLVSSAGDPAEGGLAFLFMLGMGTMFLMFALGTVLLVLASIPLPIALAHFAFEDRFSAAFEVRTWWTILRRNLLGVLIGWVVVMGLVGVLWIASLALYYTFILICLLAFLVMPAYFYVLLVGSALYGDLYAEGRALAAGT